MLRAYKYELKPTDIQKEYLANVFGSVRFIYNLALETKISSYKSLAQKSVTAFDLMKQLTDLKRDENYKWLNEVIATSLCQSIRNLDASYKNFFRGKADFPRFKKKNGKQSFVVVEGIKIDFDNWKVCIPKMKWINFCQDRKFEGEIRRATVSRTPSGRYFISILVQNNKELPAKKLIKENTSIGIDVGLKHFATLSDGTKIDNPKFLFHNLSRLRIEQRTMQRRYVKGKKNEEQSNGFRKQKLIVAKLYEKIANQRKDFLHKLSTGIINSHDTICVEDLNIKGMIQNRSLSRAISDAGWADFVSMLKYKSDWYGKNFIQIGRFEPSSKTCSCGKVNQDLALHDREWICTCGLTHDRDILAANNIKTFGLRAQPLLVNAAQ